MIKFVFLCSFMFQSLSGIIYCEVKCGYNADINTNDNNNNNNNA